MGNHYNHFAAFVSNVPVVHGIGGFHHLPIKRFIQQLTVLAFIKSSHAIAINVVDPLLVSFFPFSVIIYQVPSEI